MRPRGFVLGMLLGLLVVVAALAQVTPAGKFVRTYPPTGDDTLAGGAGPLPNQAILPPGSVSYWAMEEAAGNRVDQPGTNDLVPSGGDSQVSGKVGNGAQLIFANPAWQMEDSISAGLTTTGDYTVAAWLNIGSGPNTEEYITLADSTPQDLWRMGRTFVISAGNRVGRFTHRDAGGEKTVGANSTTWYFPLDTWVLFIATYDSTADVLTLEVGQTSFPQNSGSLGSVGSMVAPSGNVRVTFKGSNFGSTIRYDEVGIWLRMLSYAEKQDVFAGVTY